MGNPWPSLVRCSRAAAAKSSMHHQKVSGPRLQPWRSPIKGVVGRAGASVSVHKDQFRRPHASQVGRNYGYWYASSAHDVRDAVVHHPVVCTCEV